jgi:hypothetical protein
VKVTIQVPSVFTVRFPNKVTECSSQHMPGSLPSQPQEKNSSQPCNWTKVSYKRGRSTQDGIDKEAKHPKQSEHWLNQTFTSNRYTALLEEESEEQQKAGNENTSKPPPIYISDITNISPFIQLLEQIAIQQYEVKALAHNQVKVQPKTSESYRIIIKAFTEKRMHFHTYKLKEERSYRVVLKICTTPSTLKKSELKFRT